MVQSEDIPMVMTSELCQEILRVQINLSFSCWMENKGSPSYHDVLRKVLSTSILSNSDRIYIKYLLGKPELIDIVDKVNPIPVIQKSAIEKPANNPCKNLPDSAVAKRSQMQPNIMKYTKTCVYGQMLWIGRIRSDKFRRGFVIRSFALIVPDWPILHRL